MSGNCKVLRHVAEGPASWLYGCAHSASMGASTPPHPTWPVIPTHTSVSQAARRGWRARPSHPEHPVAPSNCYRTRSATSCPSCPSAVPQAQHQYPWLGVCILCLCDVQYSTTEEPNRCGGQARGRVCGGRLTCPRAWEPEPNSGGERGPLGQGGSAVAAMTAPAAAATRD
jgi:hypothetical protein